MSTLGTDTDAMPQVVFRPGKKRKMYRQRADDPEPAADDNNNNNNNGGADNSNGKLANEANPSAPSSAIVTPTEHDGADEEAGLSVAEVLRLRNLRKHKHGGVGFRAGPSASLGDDRAPPGEENTEQGLVLHGGSADAAPQGAESAVVVGGISKRFAPQTGLVGELVNRHMEEYVESELARRKRQQQQQEQELEREQERQRQRRGDGTASAQPSLLNSGVTGGQADAQRVLHGRLLEIDLGEEARARNVAMTERARRRLQGQIDEEDPEDDSGKGGRPRKVRLGRDGKPMRSRNRRGSDDIKRDQLVEEFLSENRLDMYDTTPQPPLGLSSTDPGAHQALEEEEDGMAADDRIAEEFRREFMEAMSQRNRRRRAPQPAGGTNNKNNQQEEILRGPKLGGSRNARAAMRDLLLKEQAARGGRR